VATKIPSTSENFDDDEQEGDCFATSIATYEDDNEDQVFDAQDDKDGDEIWSQ
jgi:hypothetical protein